VGVHTGEKHKMQIIVFSKMLKNRTVAELIDLAHRNKFDGYDLCVRTGYPVNPDNVSVKLKEAVDQFKSEGLSVPMITAEGDLQFPTHPTAEPILAAMNEAGVRLLKLGYFPFDPMRQSYWEEVARIRKSLEGWERLGQKHNVKICYHTHSVRCMGLNAASLAHLIEGFDPRWIGAYLDPGHMVIEGEEFCVGVAMVRKYLSIVAVKDVLLLRKESHGHGSVEANFVCAGQGMVDWTGVFSELARIGFVGPVSVHCEFHEPKDGFPVAFEREIRFFKKLSTVAGGA